MSRPWKKHDPGALLKATLSLLRETKRTQLDIYEATGINPGWQTRFLAGKIADPGVNRIECLYAYLTGVPFDDVLKHWYCSADGFKARYKTACAEYNSTREG